MDLIIIVAIYFNGIKSKNAQKGGGRLPLLLKICNSGSLLCQNANLMTTLNVITQLCIIESFVNI